jgi:hypothetical protein
VGVGAAGRRACGDCTGGGVDSAFIPRAHTQTPPVPGKTLTWLPRRLQGEPKAQRRRYNIYMHAPTPQETLALYEQMAQTYRAEERWEALYQTIPSIIDLLRWFPEIAEDAPQKANEYEAELAEVEQRILSQLFEKEPLIETKLSLLDSQVSVLFEHDSSAEAIKSAIRKHLIMGRSLSERLNDLSYVVRFEDADMALQLWEAHLRAAWCYAAVFHSGVYRPPFSVVTCRVPEWLIEFWYEARPAQRERIVEGLLLIGDSAERFDRWIALEDCTEWLADVRRWLLWRGRWRAARRLSRLAGHIQKRQEWWSQQAEGESTLWLLPVTESPSDDREPTPSPDVSVRREE